LTGPIPSFMMSSVKYSTLGYIIIILVSAAFLVGCSVADPIPPTETATVTWTPLPTNTPTPTATPTPTINLFLGAAEQAEFNGDWDRALAGYDQAVAFALDPEEIVRAELGRGRTLIQQGDLAGAVQSLSAFLALDLGEGTLAAHLLRAEAQEQLGNYAEAAQDFSTAAGLVDIPLQDWILEREGDAWSYAGFQEESSAAYKRALEVLFNEADFNLELKYARSLDRLDEKELALERYRSIYSAYDEPIIKAQMDFLIGKALQWLGDSESADVAFYDAVVNYPETVDAYSSLAALINDGYPVDDLTRGIVDFYANEYLAAQTAFERYILSDPEGHAGIVHHYLALIYRNQGDYPSALEEWDLLIETHPGDENIPLAWEQKVRTLWAYLDQYQASWELSLAFQTLDPSHPRAAEFLYDAAAIAEMGGQLSEAIELWDRVADEHPTYERAHEARFMSGITSFRLGENAQALNTFQKALEAASTPADRAADQLWIGKTYIALGQTEQAQAAWQFALAEDPGGYYGLRADDLISGRAPFTTLPNYEFPQDTSALRIDGETWLKRTFGITPELDLSDLGSDLMNHPRVLRGDVLWDIGTHAQAKLEFNLLRDEIDGNPELMYRLMNYLVDLGLYQPAIYLAADLLDMAGMASEPASETSTYLSYIRFGPYFSELILNEAKNADFDGLFILAVNRQESLFESFATSYAAARGLMQIIPSTGEYLWSKAGWPSDFTIDDLFRPVVSVHYGVLYLEEQRDYFDGDLYATLAAYNAGPGNSLAWVLDAQGDPDLFLEIIRIQQPQDYIRSIYWAYRQYQALYVTP
jgi:soluble lytic murein transglycosylase